MISTLAIANYRSLRNVVAPLKARSHFSTCF